MKPHWQYLSYVIRHKWFVLLAGLSLRVPLWQLIVHDWSKFLPCEWFPYVRFFYGMPTVGDVVQINCIDGFGGPAEIIQTRRDKFAKYRVRMCPGEIGEGQEFWAHDFEIEGYQRSNDAFDMAWNHHQKCQPHHWQYWLLTMDSGETRSLQMPERFVREMVADWIGAGRAITGDGSLTRTAAWYQSNREKMQLHPATRERVEELLAVKQLEFA